MIRKQSVSNSSNSKSPHYTFAYEISADCDRHRYCNTCQYKYIHIYADIYFILYTVYDNRVSTKNKDASRDSWACHVTRSVERGPTNRLPVTALIFRIYKNQTGGLHAF